MKQLLYLFILFFSACFANAQSTNSQQNHYLYLLKEMFEKMVEPKDASLISHYYHPDFLLYANGKTMDYQHYLALHEKVYKTPIQYTVRYDDNTLLEQGHRVAGRVYITITMPHEQPKEIEVILIVEYKDDKIYRIWELTYPDWSKMPTFKELN